ncbi:MAG: UDP-3-O-acyl-N-acetylglucosamine deacetylase [Planctomycetota bacterium]|jgi:UDP-3-O-[3-hydroxymyristoyl] N-acetylglucosamine deacetylase/3-hydroxyacyl-[acyl-carrier-protein] dehydratase
MAKEKRNQRTIAKAATFSGQGLFSGVPCSMAVNPAEPDTGITFVRTDLPDRPEIPLSHETISGKFRRVGVVGPAGEVNTVEHLLSAAFGLQVDNLEVEIDAAELPHTDGSSLPFVEMLRESGFVEQEAQRKAIQLREPISVVEDGASIVALPSDGPLTISYTMEYDGTIGRQHFTVEVNESSYTEQISPARTFCLQSEAEAFQQQGLGKGGSYETALVVGPDGPINNSLRFPDEYVRHKILDLIGDLAALGGELRAHVVSLRSGHTANIKLVRKIAGRVTGKRGPERRHEILLDVRELAKILPHRYPMLLIDRVTELDGYRRAVGIKNVTFNEPFFQGHFPGEPIMPGVLQIEAMAQLAGALLMRKLENQNKTPVLLSLDGVKLRKSVVPGDQLQIEVETIKLKTRTGEVYARGTVDGQIAAEATMKFMLMDRS